MAEPNIKFYYTNEWWDSAVTLTSSGEATNFPDTNTQTRQRSNRWRSTGDTTEWIMIEGTNIPADGAFIFGHNLTAAATVTVEANATDAWGAPSVSETMTRTSIDRQSQYVKIFASTQTYNFWRFTFADAANPDGYISIGVPWLGEMGYEPTNGVSSEAGPVLISNSIINVGDGGQVSGIQRPGQRGLALPFSMIAGRQNFENFVFDVGTTMPFVAQLKPWTLGTYASPEDWSYYVRFTNMPTLTGISLDMWRGDMSVVEEL